MGMTGASLCQLSRENTAVKLAALIMPLTPYSLQCGTAVASQLWGWLRKDVGDE